ncbi:Fucose permease [Pedobacter steynii]|uniref:Fucose permease n=1 Tax=Pedobacter steynii TaxID=430522 RepID=A0A1G9WYG4_9SPHI|nr:MFS transporter [Pedobacter steynii]NQX40425.1 MFS transporter [Pedobacter steynii]SDM89226.1 Fucose permease [Pedobacter steynii]
MEFLKIKISVFINYLLFGIMLNSVGTVILQAQRYYGVSASSAAVLEAFKDITIAVVSFIVASFITRIGYKKSMQIGLAAVAIGCFIVPSIKTFIAVKLLFAITGASFALIKISVFGTIGLITKTEKAHVSLMSFVESFFMIGILSGYFLFSYFIDDADAASGRWFSVYYLIGAFYLLALLLVSISPLDESAAKPEPGMKFRQSYTDMLKLLMLPLVVSFVICAFLYVLIEQSIMSWLPTFNNKVLHLPSSISVLMAGIMASSTAIGRFLAGVLLKRISWYICLTVCLFAAAGLVLIAIPLASNAGPYEIRTWADVPFAAYIFPLIGFFLAPIYPAINSVILGALPKNQHGTMSGLIVVFSALGGSLGSLITGYIFQHYGGQTAFYFSLLPIATLTVALFLFQKMKTRHLIEHTLS